MIDPEEDRKHFISIRELITAMATATGKTEQQAAAMLSASLRKLSAWDGLAFYEWSPAYGCTPVNRGLGSLDAKARLRIAVWAATGTPSETYEEMMNDDIPF